MDWRASSIKHQISPSGPPGDDAHTRQDWRVCDPIPPWHFTSPRADARAGPAIRCERSNGYALQHASRVQHQCPIPRPLWGHSDWHVLQGFHQGSDDSTDSTRHPELRSLVADQITSPNNSIFILFRDLRKNRAHRQAVGFCFSYPLQSKVHRTHCSAIV